MLKILSLFDWISGGQQALERIWITNCIYYASEIDKYAIQVTQHNYPNTIQIWDVTKINWEDYKDITLLAGWSPCQWFSFAWKQLNFEDPRSKLFFEYVRILNEIKPKYFLLENVKMKKEYQDIISDNLFWIQPIIINSSLLSAQNRNRLYWVWELQPDSTYKQVEIEQPEDKWILLKDILEEVVDEKYYLSDEYIERIKNRKATQKPLNRLLSDTSKSPCLTARWAGEDHSGMILYKEWLKIEAKLNVEIPFTKFRQDNVFCGLNDKVPTLTTVDWWLRPKVYCINSKDENWQQPPQQDRVYDTNWKMVAQTASLNWRYNILTDYKIRKLTPTECERLQTVKDWFTSIISNSQRYKALGNWWTIDVIAHIFNYLDLK